METILIHRLGSLGDTVVALPCFHKVARVFPNTRRLVVTNFPVSHKAAPLEQILGGSGLIDGTLSYQAGVRNIGALLELARTIRKTGARTLVYFPASRPRLSVWRDFLFFRLSGIRKFIGMSSSPEHNRVRVDPRTGLLEREVERLVRGLSELGPIDLNDPKMWDLHFSDEEVAKADRLLAPLAGLKFVVVNVGGKASSKDWGDANWRQALAAVSAENTGLAAVFVGSADESARCEELAKIWQGPVLNAAGVLTPRECGAVLDRAVAFVGHDSGPMHLAASRGTRCVALFGSNNRPNQWHPWGRHHRVLHDVMGLENIRPAEVVKEIREVLLEKTTS